MSELMSNAGDWANWIPSLLGAVAGGVSGGAISLWIGPTKAEREEKGRKRIEARRSIDDALGEFRYSLTEYRLALYDDREGDVDSCVMAAVGLGAAVQEHAEVLPRIQRCNLSRRIRRLIGTQAFEIAKLRPRGASGRLQDSARLEAVARTRQGDSPRSFSERLLLVSPTDKKWVKIIEDCDRCRKSFRK